MASETIMIQTEECEMEACQDQINYLQQTINSLKSEVDLKDKILAKENKEKERIQAELKKHKQSNLNLKQQLEDERDFYLKEKEYYCKEMSEAKRARSKQPEDVNNPEQIAQMNELVLLRAEVLKLKSIVNETLEANYNLSVTFLRMKNTKYCLKAVFKRSKSDNAKIVKDLSGKVDMVRQQIAFVESDTFLRQTIPPSNKQYLQILKQNTHLIHENLRLQVIISKLHSQIERIKADKVKLETNFRLQYIKKSRHKHKLKIKKTSKSSQTVTFNDDTDYFIEENVTNYATRSRSVPEMVRTRFLSKDDSDISINYM